MISGYETYGDYFKNKQASLHEEAIANASALRHVRTGSSNNISDRARKWMRKQGSGYKDFSKWVNDNKFQMGLRQATNNISPGVPNIVLTGLRKFDWNKRPAEFLFDHAIKCHPRTYVVVEPKVSWLRIVKRFEKENGLQVHVHTNDHKPKHIHVEFFDGSNPNRNRYKWDSLDPFKDTPPRSRSVQNQLKSYVNKYRKKIQKKINAVPWA